MAAPGERGSRGNEPDATATIAASFLPLLPPLRTSPAPASLRHEHYTLQMDNRAIRRTTKPTTPTNRHGTA
jgi:hypothetical protein